MSVFDIIGGILLILVAICVIATVAMQEGSKSGVNALGGPNADTSRSHGKTMNAMLSRATKFFAIAFFALTILIAVVDKFVK